jgi:ribosome biogenesis GTPase
VVLDGEERVECFLRGKLLKERSQNLVVGDRVAYEPIGAGQGVIAGVEPRRTELRRAVREAGRRKAERRGGKKDAPHAQDQVVLANAEQAILVVAAREPGVDLDRLDRSLALARAAGLAVAIVVNKMDLADAEAMRGLMRPYEEMGVPLLYLSASREEGLSALRDLTRGRISLFWGGSGVGKSTLSGKLTGRAIKVGVWNEKNPRGPHTTTDSCLYPLPYGGYLADTPGFDTLLLDTLNEEEHPAGWLLPEA